jgi:protein regulator of cytokinesis 1
MAVDTSYLTTQVNNIVEQLHGIFDDIGVPARERDSREAEVSENSSTYTSACEPETD